MRWVSRQGFREKGLADLRLFFLHVWFELPTFGMGNTTCRQEEMMISVSFGENHRNVHERGGCPTAVDIIERTQSAGQNLSVLTELKWLTCSNQYPFCMQITGLILDAHLVTGSLLSYGNWDELTSHIDRSLNWRSCWRSGCLKWMAICRVK